MATLNALYGDHLVFASRGHATPRQKPGTDDVRYQEFDNRTMEQLIQESTTWWMLKTVLELSLQLEHIACANTLSLVAPPSYEESLSDLPPDYTTTDHLATRGTLLSHDTPQPIFTCAKSGRADVKIDWTGTDNVRQHVSKKKAKQAAKQAQQAKWAESDEEGNKDGTADGGDGNGDDGAGAGGAGGGSDPPGGGDKDDDDWWNEGKKDKKKKKKNAWYACLAPDAVDIMF